MPPLLYTLVASGASVSDTINLTTYGRPTVLGVPGITSGDLLVQGSFTPTSADFSRMLEVRSPGSGDLRFATGPGSRMAMWPETLRPPPYLRFETSVAQTNPATLTLLVRGG